MNQTNALYPIIGIVPGSSQPIKISPNSQNFHVLLSGISGSGKTVTLQFIERNLCLHPSLVLVFDFNGSHTNWFDPSCHEIENRIVMRTDGFPFPLLRSSPLQNELLFAETLVKMFCSVSSRLGIQQEEKLFQALCLAQNTKKEFLAADDFLLIKNALRSVCGSASNSIFAHFRTLFTVKVAKKNPLLTGKINVIDFSGFDADDQAQLANFCLAFIWQRFLTSNLVAPVPLFLVLDEFHNLDFSLRSSLASLLREGRKFNIHIVLATQSLCYFSKKERTILDQVSTNLYFYPTDDDLKLISDSLYGIPSVEAKKLLKTLPVGYYIANGNFQFGNQTKLKALRLTAG